MRDVVIPECIEFAQPIHFCVPMKAERERGVNEVFD